MSIVLITGPAGSGKSLIANAMRNNQIAHGNAALLVDEGQDGDPIPLLEKIIDGQPLTAKTPFANIPWKRDPMVILVGDKAEMLDVFEDLVPGFTAGMGETFTILAGNG